MKSRTSKAPEGSPVRILSCSLLKEYGSPNGIVNVGLLSTAENVISAIRLKISLYNSAGDEISSAVTTIGRGLAVESQHHIEVRFRYPGNYQGAVSAAASVESLLFADGVIASGIQSDELPVSENLQASDTPVKSEPIRQTEAKYDEVQITEPGPEAEIIPELEPVKEKTAEEIAAEQAKKQKTKKLAKRIGIISGASATAACLVIFLMIPSIKYVIAGKAVKNGEFADAASRYDALNGFMQSEQNYVVSRALESIEQQNYNGISNILKTGIPVDLSYKLTGGHFVNQSAQEHVVFSSPEQYNGLEEVKKDYYVFDSWRSSVSYDMKKNSAVIVNAEAVFTPVDYSIKYTDLYDAQNINPETFNVESAKITLKDPVRTGYTFDGWTGDGANSKKSIEIPAGSHGNKSYSANWTANTYKVKILPGDEEPAKGSSLEETEFGFVFDDEYKLPELQKRGYEFEGWSDGAELYREGIWKNAGDLTLKPSFRLAEYTLEYDLAGGEIAEDNPAKYNMLDDDITLIEPARFGYKFTGWRRNGGSAEKPAVIKSGSVGNMKFTATWQGNPHTVSLDANGGSVSSANYGVVFGSSYTLPTPSKTGYDFAGWYNSGKQYSSGTWNMDKDFSVSAKWTPRSYTIPLNYNGGSGSPSNLNVTFDANYTVPNPRRTGYNFTGWYYNGTQYSGGTWKTDGNITLTAAWEGKKYTVSLDANGGYVSSPSYTATYGSSYSLPTPSRTGYNFTGWSTSSRWGSSFRQDGVWDTDGNVSLYATWEVKTCTIYLDPAGGDLWGGRSQTVKYDSSYYLDTPSRTGYDFDGWYYGNTRFDTRGVYQIDGDVSLTAHWTGKSYTVRLDGNGGSVSSSRITVTYGSYYSLPEPYRSGYIFEGWYNSSGRYGSYFPSSGTWMETGGESLYAHWSEAPVPEPSELEE